MAENIYKNSDSNIDSTSPQELKLNTTYEFDFFNSSQISMYIGDVLVDDVVGLTFSVSQSKQPIYGYASQYFHTVSAGQVLVQGSFAINFKEAGYLLETLRRYNNKMTPISAKDNQQYVNKLNIEKTIDIERIFQDTVKSKSMQGFLKSTDKISSNAMYEILREISVQPDEIFENYVEAFEDHLWLDLGSDLNTNNLKHQAGDKEYMNHRRADQYPPFDIWILYGDISNKAANHTIRKILDVHILGQGQQISADGQVIMEEFNFIAKNLV